MAYRAATVAVFALGSLGACASPRADFQRICDAEKTARAAEPNFAALPLQDQLGFAVSAAAKRVKSEEGMNTLSALASVNPADKAELLRRAAAEQGVSPCAVADFMDRINRPDPVTGCTLAGDQCNLETVPAGFAAAFEKLPDRDGKSLTIRRVTQKDLEALAGARSLRRLNLLDCSGVSDLAPLKTLTGLRYLQVAGAADLKLDALKELKELDHLFLSRWAKGDPADLAQLGALPKLEYLSLTENEWLTDVSALSAFGGLEMFELRGSAVSDVAPLSKLPRLQKLNLNGTRVTDLSVLKSFPALREVSLARDYPAAQLDPLKQALPRVRFSSY